MFLLRLLPLAGHESIHEVGDASRVDSCMNGFVAAKEAPKAAAKAKAPAAGGPPVGSPEWIQSLSKKNLTHVRFVVAIFFGSSAFGGILWISF